MTGFLLLLAMGTAAWWAWPAATTFPAKVWTIFFALFLAPFSWPWLAARGYRARKATGTAEQRNRLAVAERQRDENAAWWINEHAAAEYAGDTERAGLARDVLGSMGFTMWGSPGNRGWTKTSRPA